MLADLLGLVVIGGIIGVGLAIAYNLLDKEARK